LPQIHQFQIAGACFTIDSLSQRHRRDEDAAAAGLGAIEPSDHEGRIWALVRCAGLELPIPSRFGAIAVLFVSVNGNPRRRGGTRCA
jgi:hypothetical protein